MPLTITLKNKANADVVFTEYAHQGNEILLRSPGTSLLDTKQLSIVLRPNGATNRVMAKLSVPTVGVIPTSGVQSILWTEVGSFDLSSVKAATTEAADDFIAMFGSLANSNTVKRLYSHGGY